MPSSGRRGFQQAEQHFLDAAGAGGLELLLNFGFQGCVAGFRWSWLLLGIKVTRKDDVNQQNPRRDGAVESHVSQRKREMGTRLFPSR